MGVRNRNKFEKWQEFGILSIFWQLKVIHYKIGKKL